MALIIKESFQNLLVSFDRKNDFPYIGMGNPNSKILFVGSEKALDSSNPLYNEIFEHELFLNFEHWFNVLQNSNHLTDPFDLILQNRNHPFNGFNPFNPLIFEITSLIVRNSGAGHTYFGLQRLLNAYENLNNEEVSNIFSDRFTDNTFSKCFITELSANPARNQVKANFKLNEFLISERYEFMRGIASEFYQDFETVVIYCGKNNRYVGLPNSDRRLEVLRIFNPHIVHGDLRQVNINGCLFDVYENNNGAKLILTRHLSSGFGYNMANAIASEI